MKDAYLIAGICVVAIVAGALLFMFGGNLSLSGRSGDVHFSVLAEGKNANTSERRNYRITNTEELQALWQLIYGNSQTPPAVDFAKHEVLAIFDGSHSESGYAVKATSVVDSGLTRTVAVEHDAPGALCKTTGALSSPFQVILVTKMDAHTTLTHTDTDRVIDCN